MNLKNIMLSERGQTQKILYVSIYLKYLEKANL